MQVRKLIALLFALFLGTLSAHAVWAEKLTSDPNAPDAAQAPRADQADADKRLDQKVTYATGQVRLHAVAEDLTRLTGVKIRSGSNSKEWQIRDIPLVVCVKEFPLGKLLKAISESTHTILRSEKLEDGERVYRFYRSKRAQDAIDGKLQAAQQKQYEQIDWAWDAMLKLADSPEAQQELADAPPSTSGGMLAVARALASLGPGGKDRVLSSETLSVDLTGPMGASIAEGICAGHCDLYRRMGGVPVYENGKLTQLPMAKLKPDDLIAAGLSVQLRTDDRVGLTDVCVHHPPLRCGGQVAVSQRFPLTMFSGALENMKTLNLPPRPKGEEIADQESDVPADRKLRALADEKDWARKPFATKVKLQAPKGKTLLTFADTIAALAETSGVNIVAEDFLSHNVLTKDHYGQFFGVETTPAELLKKSFCTWFHDGDDRLLVGWAWSKGRWRTAHRNLVPESLLINLTSRLETGVELDDISPVASLSREQCWDWIWKNRDTSWLSRAFEQNRVLWQLYDSLSSSDKKLAKGETGLPLAKLDTANAATFLKERFAQDEKQTISTLQFAADKNEQAGFKASMETLFDPGIMRTSVMRVSRTQASYPSIPAGESILSGLVWREELHHSYVMEIDYEKDGQKATFRTSDLNLSLPMYSAKREKELTPSAGSGRK